MKKNKKILIGLFILFICLLGLTIYTSFSSNIELKEVRVKSMHAVYDPKSSVVIKQEKGLYEILFNDKNQAVDYEIVIENTQDYDVKVTDIKLSTPTEEFLQYEIENLEKDSILKAKSTKELTIHLETTGIEGWGRNFADELTANISFEKTIKQEEVTPPVDEDKDDTQLEAPATNTEELTSKTKKIEIASITDEDIEISTDIKLEDGDKVDAWIYPDPTYIGNHEVKVKDDTKKIVGIVETLKKKEVSEGEHNIALVSEANITLGYVSIYVNENNEILKEKSQDTTEKEENLKDENSNNTKPSGNKPSTNNKEEASKEDEENKVENPYTSDKGLIAVLVIATSITGFAIIVVSKNKFIKYTIFIITLSSTLTLVRAEKAIELPITLNVNFKSQNVMSKAFRTEEYCYPYGYMGCVERNNPILFWLYSIQIKNIYIENEIKPIDEYEYKFDVTEAENNRVTAYLVKNGTLTINWGSSKSEEEAYDLYIQADGIIYPNKDARSYFADMEYLDSINNLAGLDTSEVTNMSNMFYRTGYNSKSFTMDVSHFNTSNVTDMKGMFYYTGFKSQKFTLDVSNFDTSNVTDMGEMFDNAGYSSPIFTIDVSNFDTSKVTNMAEMFSEAGYTSEIFTLDVSNFDTSKVTDMSSMFRGTGYTSEIFTLDVSNFDTSKVTNMRSMFGYAGYNSKIYTLDVSNFDTSKVTDMGEMFNNAGYSSPIFTIDVSNFDTSKVTDMGYMFYKTGYTNPNFTLDVSNFDTSKAREMWKMFNSTGYNSTVLNTSITIKNRYASYDDMFFDAATKKGSQIKVNYTFSTADDIDSIIATKTEGANVIKGDLIVDIDNLSIEDELHINEEKFNVISQTDDTISMLAQETIGYNYKQTFANYTYAFSDSAEWEPKEGPQEIDIQKWSTYPKEYVNGYVDYLKTELGDGSVTGDLITLKQLSDLGCTIQKDYSYNDYGNCYNAPEWLYFSGGWWTRSALSNSTTGIWYVRGYDVYGNDYHYNRGGIRPVITVSKASLKKYFKTS